MCVCVCVCLCMLWVASGIIVNIFEVVPMSRYSFVYFGVKTIQRAVPAKTCKTRRENEGRWELGVRL